MGWSKINSKNEKSKSSLNTLNCLWWGFSVCVEFLKPHRWIGEKFWIAVAMHVSKVIEVNLEAETTPDATGMVPEKRDSLIACKHE